MILWNPSGIVLKHRGSRKDDVIIEGEVSEGTAPNPEVIVPSGFAEMSAVTLLSQVGILAASLVTSVVLARVLGADGKGQLALVLQVIAIAAVVLGLGIDAANTYYVGRHGLAVGDATGDSVAAALTLTVVGIPVLYALLRFGMPALDSADATVLVFGCLLLLPSLLAAFLNGILVGLSDVRVTAIVGVTASVLAMGMTVGLAVSGRLSVQAAMLVTLAGAVLQVVLQGGALRRHGRPLMRMPSVRRLRERAGYGAKAYVTTIAGFLDRRQDVLILGVLSTPAVIGIYTVGVVFAQLLWQIPRAVSPALMSHSLRLDGDSGAAVAATTCRITFALSVIAMLLMAVLLLPLIPLLYGSDFAGAYWVFLLLAPGVAVYGIAAVLINYLMAHGKPMPRIYVTIAVLNLVLNLILIPLMQELGAAISSTVSYSVGGVLVGLAFTRETGVSIRSTVVPRREDVRLFLRTVARLTDRTRPA